VGYLAATCVLALGYFFDESTCLWRVLTGLPCPGCGMVHAFLALGRGDVQAAWRFNANSFIVGPIVLWTGIQKLRGVA
jgi:hypothetical protein